MILIIKGKEPKAWTQYRLTPGVDYQSIPELVDSLLKEQGYICAYCMRRIPHKDKLFVKEDGAHYNLTNENHRVEHIKSREKHDDLKLNYSNMVVCCPGHIGDENHCDRKKDSNDISFSPLDAAFISTLSYTSEGEIKSSNAAYNNDIENTLNLNTKLLVINRKSVREKIIVQLNATCKRSGKWDKALLIKYLSKYENMHSEDGCLKYYPYCGVIIWYIRKKLSQL